MRLIRNKYIGYTIYVQGHLDHPCLDVLDPYPMNVHCDGLADFISTNQDQHAESID